MSLFKAKTSLRGHWLSLKVFWIQLETNTQLVIVAVATLIGMTIGSVL